MGQPPGGLATGDSDVACAISRPCHLLSHQCRCADTNKNGEADVRSAVFLFYAGMVYAGAVYHRLHAVGYFHAKKVQHALECAQA